MPDDQRAPNNLSLDMMGIREATDKNSLIGDYLRHYEKLFAHLRHQVFNFIEIGVFRGASARTWERFFTGANIIGVDIDPECRRCATERVKIEIGSQNDPEFLHRLVTTYPPQVIIDDGSHQSYDVIFTFERLFPALLPGGIYVIEDLHFHLRPDDAERLRGGSPILASDYVTDLARDRLGSESYLRQLPGIRRYLVGSVDRIEIIGQAVFFHKKGLTDPLQATLNLLPHVEAANNWLIWFTFAQRVMEHGGDDQMVAHGLRQAVALNGTSIIVHERLSEALERLGDIDGAIAILEAACGLATGDSGMRTNLLDRTERLRKRHGR
jgi:hypothetical protein